MIPICGKCNPCLRILPAQQFNCRQRQKYVPQRTRMNEEYFHYSMVTCVVPSRLAILTCAATFSEMRTNT